jgi:hypothetical protein
VNRNPARQPNPARPTPLSPSLCQPSNSTGPLPLPRSVRPGTKRLSPALLSSPALTARSSPSALGPPPPARPSRSARQLAPRPLTARTACRPRLTSLSPRPGPRVSGRPRRPAAARHRCHPVTASHGPPVIPHLPSSPRTQRPPRSPAPNSADLPTSGAHAKATRRPTNRIVSLPSSSHPQPPPLTLAPHLAPPRNAPCAAMVPQLHRASATESRRRSSALGPGSTPVAFPTLRPTPRTGIPDRPADGEHLRRRKLSPPLVLRPP